MLKITNILSKCTDIWENCKVLHNFMENCQFCRKVSTMQLHHSFKIAKCWAY